MSAGKRRLGGWGFDGEKYPPSAQLLAWLADRVGPAAHPVPMTATTPPDISPKDLGHIPALVSLDPMDRLRHARGQGLADIVRLRSGLVPALPDGVCRPADVAEVESVLSTCAARDICVIPWGGGTSVTGGVNVVADDAPVLTLDLERLGGCTGLDKRSNLATFGPGTNGPEVEIALAEHGLTLGHFPQSWELATVGGWVATRSSGQESLGYGRIEDMVAGLDLVGPGGRLRVPTGPASAAGPDLARLVMGSEGRLGVITEITLRVRRRPERTVVVAALLPDLDRGLESVRDLVQRGLPLTLVRLSDAPETQVAMAVGLGKSAAAPLVERYLSLRGLGRDACLLLFGTAGNRHSAESCLRHARAVVRSHRGVSLGKRPGRHWLRDRFRHPYLRDSLLDLGYATDTLETAATWTSAARVRETVKAAISDALSVWGERVATLCHVSHPYPDGASLYFTFFFRCAPSSEETITRWAVIKRAATAALSASRVTLSHHHGIGQWHAPWLEAEIGSEGLAVITATAQCLDPGGIMNRHVLLDPTDRLEQ
jgi:alkyldihydroxyacetonephosphate synthase